MAQVCWIRSIDFVYCQATARLRKTELQCDDKGSSEIVSALLSESCDGLHQWRSFLLIILADIEAEMQLWHYEIDDPKKVYHVENGASVAMTSNDGTSHLYR